MAAYINPGKEESSPDYLSVFNNKIFFQAKDSSGSKKLWSCDTSDTCSMVFGIASPWHLTVFNNKLYF